MIVLAIDTCLGACSAAVIDSERVLAVITEPMWRGHQERLGSLAMETMEEARISFSDLDRVGATVGPGSFTGLRVGVAFAKGLGVALRIPVVGVGTLAAFAIDVAGPSLAVADARRGQVYWQAFDDGEAVSAATVSAIDTLTAQAPRCLLGPGASLVAAFFPQAEPRPSDAANPVAIARLAAAAPLAPIAPLYLRPPDAKLPGGIDPFAA